MSSFNVGTNLELVIKAFRGSKYEVSTYKVKVKSVNKEKETMRCSISTGGEIELSMIPSTDVQIKVVEAPVKALD